MLRPGTITILTAAVTWVGGVGTAVFSPPSFSRYIAFGMASAGAPTALGETAIVTSMLDGRRAQEYILAGSTTSSPARGVPLRHIASLGGTGPGPRWRGTWSDTANFIRTWIGAEGLERAATGLRKWFGEPEPDTAFIPVDGDFTVTLERLQTGDEPSTLSLMVIDMGRGDESEWSDLTPFGRPYWWPFSAIAITTALLATGLVTDKLVVPAGRYVGEGIKGSLIQRTLLASIYDQDDGALDTTQPALVQLSSQTQDDGKSRFEPGMAPIQLAANPLSPMLPVWDRGFAVSDQLYLDYAKAATAEDAWVYAAYQFVASRLPKGK